MSSVKLYVYDLSNGMARQMSLQMTGRQIDGIWHTSVVVFEKEIFYGQGISITQPGRSHHGQPLQVIDMGETGVDEDTLNDYLGEMKTYYTADKYHLLDFNCNSFTNDCIGFLTGKSIPPFIKDLPSDFLSTPFGAALRPTIDSMYRRPTPGSTPPISSSTPASSLLQSVASQAQGSTSGAASSSITAPIHIITNSAAFNNFVQSNRAAIALFTAPATCPPCRMIEPVYERLAEEKGKALGKKGAGFATIDTDSGLTRALSTEWGIRATPTFMFFLDGKKVDELKGADPSELRSQIDLLLFQAFPPHAHTSLSLPAVESLSLNPILFTQVPSFDTMLLKQAEFIEAHWQQSSTDSGQNKDSIKRIISGDVIEYLKARYPPTNNSKEKVKLPSAKPTTLAAWSQATSVLSNVLPTEALFPIADMWRLAFLDPAVATWVLSITTASVSDPISTLLPKAATIISSTSPSKGARNFLLIVLRLLCNTFSNLALAGKLTHKSAPNARISRDQIKSVLVPSLLHDDPMVRTAGASLAFNIAASLQKERVDVMRTGGTLEESETEEQAEWETELIAAVVEAVDREKENEEVVHRLVASLAFLLRLAPHYDSHIKPFLEVLQSRQTLKSKLGAGWNAEGGVKKKELRKLVEEVAEKLCI